MLPRLRVTAPRQILPGTTYLVSRRCAQREFLLRPSEMTNSIFLYVLAVAAQRHGIAVHAWCVLSNHYHLVVTDPDARLPAFLQYLNGLVARALNAWQGRWEAFWAPTVNSAVELVTADDIVDKAAYVLANPAAAGLVMHGATWLGLWSNPEDFGRGPFRVQRPAFFFREDGDMPAEVDLELTAPPRFDSVDAFRERVKDALKAREEEARSRRRATAPPTAAEHGPQPAGALVGASDRPSTRAPRRKLSPRVAARDAWRRIEVLCRIKEFRTAYRAAREKFVSGTRDVVFPPGTYWLRVTQGVPCLAPG